jgi:hypothetical protein
MEHKLIVEARTGHIVGNGDHVCFGAANKTGGTLTICVTRPAFQRLVDEPMKNTPTLLDRGAELYDRIGNIATKKLAVGQADTNGDILIDEDDI